MRQKGLILVFTGDGKGKTTAALGTALRMIARGGRVGMVQFFKGGTKGFASNVARCPLRQEKVSPERWTANKFGRRIKLWSFGGGFTWQVSREDNGAAAEKAWRKCRDLLRSPKYDLVIFDEIHIALTYRFLNAADVLKALKVKIPSQHVILTGQCAPKSILRIADLVTEMKCLKHPFDRGIPAQPGLDF